MHQRTCANKNRLREKDAAKNKTTMVPYSGCALEMYEKTSLVLRSFSQKTRKRRDKRKVGKTEGEEWEKERVQ